MMPASPLEFFGLAQIQRQKMPKEAGEGRRSALMACLQLNERLKVLDLSSCVM